jgi:hypothetical protein
VLTARGWLVFRAVSTKRTVTLSEFIGRPLCDSSTHHTPSDCGPPSVKLGVEVDPALNVRCHSSYRHSSCQTPQTHPDNILLVLLALSLSYNVYLASKGRSQNSGRPQPTVSVGTKVPALVAQSSGRPVRIGYSGTTPTVLYVFSPQCKWCEVNAPDALALASQQRASFRFVALSLTPDAAGMGRALTERFMVLSHPSPDTVVSYGLGATPETMVISPEGVLMKRWAGAYQGDVKREVEQFFHAVLPTTRTTGG